jgi:hypothetical protein
LAERLRAVNDYQWSVLQQMRLYATSTVEYGMGTAGPIFRGKRRTKLVPAFCRDSRANAT